MLPQTDKKVWRIPLRPEDGCAIYKTGAKELYEVSSMDEIEQGFTAIMERIRLLEEEKVSLAADIKKNDAALLERMAVTVRPLVPVIGLEMLKKGKKDGKGEIYDAMYFEGKMVVLGKAQEPMEYRPDNMQRPVTNQFCALSEDGNFLEIMYTVDDFIIDTYANTLTAAEVLDLYGYDIMYMLYRALHDYMKEESRLVDALNMTLAFVFEKE
jgi:hypothetical protein